MSQVPRVALTMIVRDGAATIGRCLESVRGAVDEMIVVDTGSTDATREIAVSCGARVVSYPWRDHFAEARNVSLRHSTAEWNLVLDHDEYLAGGAAEALRRATQGPLAIGRITRVSVFEQDGQPRLSRDAISRLLPRGAYFEGRVHEQVVSALPRRATGIEVHHDGDLRADKAERNARLLELALAESGDDPYLLYHLAKHHRLRRQHDLAHGYYGRAYAALDRGAGYAPNLIVDYLHNCIARGDVATALALVETEGQALAEYPDFHFARGLLYMHGAPPGADPFVLIEEAFGACLALGETARYDSVVGTGSFLAAHNLGLMYELLGDGPRAAALYERAAAEGYQPSAERLHALAR